MERVRLETQHVNLTGVFKGVVDPHMLFFVERNKNRNVVVYSSGAGVSPEPYWNNLELDPTGRDVHSLTRLEAFKAYGVRPGAVHADAACINFTIVSIPHQVMTMFVDESGKRRCITRMGDGTPLLLHRVYVYARERLGLFPKVLHIELHGTLKDGSKAAEKLTPRRR